MPAGGWTARWVVVFRRWICSRVGSCRAPFAVGSASGGGDGTWRPVNVKPSSDLGVEAPDRVGSLAESPRRTPSPLAMRPSTDFFRGRSGGGSRCKVRWRSPVDCLMSFVTSRWECTSIPPTFVTLSPSFSPLCAARESVVTVSTHGSPVASVVFDDTERPTLSSGWSLCTTTSNSPLAVIGRVTVRCTVPCAEPSLRSTSAASADGANVCFETPM